MGIKSNVPVGSRVRVYFNLHKRLYSVICWESGDERKGKVILHTKQVILDDCVFIVQPAGRARVLETRQKNVHAYIQGRWSRQAPTDGPAKSLSYNPYRADTFMSLGTPVLGASRVEGTVINRHPAVVFLP